MYLCMYQYCPCSAYLYCPAVLYLYHALLHCTPVDAATQSPWPVHVSRLKLPAVYLLLLFAAVCLLLSIHCCCALLLFPAAYSDATFMSASEKKGDPTGEYTFVFKN